MTLSIVTAPPALRLRPSPVVLLRSRDVPHADRFVRAGELIRVRRGVYASRGAWRDLTPWDRYLARVHAAILSEPGAVFCHESAAALWGLPVFGDPGVVHVLGDPDRTSRDRGGMRLHTGRGDREILDVDGVLLVGRLDTAVDVARARHRVVGLATADAALRLDAALTAQMLVAVNESRASSRGRRTARWVTHRATADAETVLESISRAAIEWLGFDEPELQRRFVTDGHTDRVDMWWPAARVVGESDGDVKYDDSLQPAAKAIRAEKDRDLRLRSHAGGIAHWGWRDVLRVDPLRHSLRSAGLQVRHAVDARELHGIRPALNPPPLDRETAPTHRNPW